MSDINWRDIAERAAWTFAEGFLVALPLTFSVGMDGAGWVSVFASAAMAGMSALKTFAIEIVKQHNKSE